MTQATETAYRTIAGFSAAVRSLLAGFFSLLRQDKEFAVYTTILFLVILMGIFGQSVAPYEFDEYVQKEDGTLKRAAPPSLSNPLGTTATGQDVFSRLLYGAQPTLLTGFFGGILVVVIGTTMGVTAGYAGGWVENVLMRITDFAYGVPLIPFAIVILAVLGSGLMTTILAIGLILWRGAARVLRSQVLQIKERPFILAAKATGMSSRGIVIKHILPNIAPMIILYFSLGIGYSILIQAGLSFVGVSNPFVPSWGVMIRNAFDSGYMNVALWWSIPPGLFISLTVLSSFMFGRKYEELHGGKGADQAIAMGGGIDE
jgi:peptide/nickel transport system permease protein